MRQRRAESVTTSVSARLPTDRVSHLDRVDESKPSGDVKGSPSHVVLCVDVCAELDEHLQKRQFLDEPFTLVRDSRAPSPRPPTRLRQAAASAPCRRALRCSPPLRAGTAKASSTHAASTHTETHLRHLDALVHDCQKERSPSFVVARFDARPLLEQNLPESLQLAKSPSVRLEACFRHFDVRDRRCVMQRRPASLVSRLSVCASADQNLNKRQSNRASPTPEIHLRILCPPGEHCVVKRRLSLCIGRFDVRAPIEKNLDGPLLERTELATAARDLRSPSPCPLSAPQT